MNNKYIIRNCPAYSNYCEEIKSYECQNCTDCIMKQIVEKCMEDWKDMMTTSFQRGLLNLLEIQEIE